MKKISVVIPSRGDVGMGSIIEHLRSYPEVDDIQVMIGTTPYNRYIGAADARQDVIFTQDDDCLTDLRPLLDAQREPGVILNAMTPEHAAQYQGKETLLGFGAIFDKSMIRALDGWDRDALFYRESDRVFATIHPHKTVFPQIKILPRAHNPNRLWKQKNHLGARFAMEHRIFELTGIRA